MLATPIRTLFVALVLMLTNPKFFHFVVADTTTDILIQLAIYSTQNDTMHDAADQESSTLMDALLGAESGDYQVIEPGQTVPVGNRRGLRRNLQVTCPPRCATSTSTYCKIIGCTKCGSTCQGRLLRRVLLDGEEASAVVADMNDVLVPYCGTDAACDIGATILVVNPDGTTTELV